MSSEPCPDPDCLSDVPVSGWDTLVGLPVRCPKCGMWSGPQWTPKRLAILAVVSLFLNALVLFFVVKPLRALFLIGMYAATIVMLMSAADPDGPLFATGMILIILGPACLVAIEYLHHQDLMRPRMVVVVSSAEPDMEKVRNELEIAIYHREDRLRYLEKTGYAIAALHAVLTVLSGRWLELTISFVLIGLAYSVRANESKAFSVLVMLFGIAILSRPVRLALPIGVILLGIGMLATTISLSRLRRMRATIPLPPAEHLKDDGRG
jgi:hypothetical protein